MPKEDKRNRPGGGPSNRQIFISKALSRLLRHQAQNDKIPIASEGWVRLDHALSWHGLSAKHRFGDKPAQPDEVFLAVGTNEKKRFALKYYKSTTKEPSKLEEDQDIADGVEDVHLTEEQAKVDDSTTAESLRIFESQTDTDPAHFFIRAVQGHSMKEISTEGLLTSITLDDPSTIPSTVVHGTFYGAWDSILKDGGLKKMKRNMIHFATGPDLNEVLPKNVQISQQDEVEAAPVDAVDAVLEKNKVISGMRGDAQILIYIDIRRCLEDVKKNGLDMEWFRSENGVILTEGIIVNDQEQDTSNGTSAKAAGEEEGVTQAGIDAREAKRKADWKKGVNPPQPQHIVPMKYWDVVVEVKAGYGILWKYGEGMVNGLPHSLRKKRVPRGKGDRDVGNRGRGRGKA